MCTNAIYTIVFNITQKLKVITLGFCVFFSPLIFSQINLIPNPSFEDSIQIPQVNDELFKCKNWIKPTGTSSDYFSAYSPVNAPPISQPNCGVSIPKNAIGFQFAKQGNFYVGGLMYANFNGNLYPERTANELFEVKLVQPLKKKYLYAFKLYYNVANGSNVASNQLGAYFTQNQFNFTFGTYFNSLIPQIRLDTNTYMTDTLNWVAMKGLFFAKGNEEYVTIGNFKDALHTKTISLTTNFQTPCIDQTNNTFFCYTYIDSVSLYEIPVIAADCAKDTTICLNDSLSLGTNVIDTARYSWQPIAGLSCTNCPNPKAKPLVTTIYHLTKKIYGTESVDSIICIVLQPTIALAGTNSSICIGSTVNLGPDNDFGYTYFWQPTIALSCSNCGLSIASPSISMTYTLTKSACGFSNSAVFIVNVKPNYTLTPKINLTNIISCLNDTLQFAIQNYPTDNFVLYNWQPLNNFITQPSVSVKALIKNNTYYYVTISNVNLSIYCPYSKKDSIYISIQDTCTKEIEPFLPNLFTPNGDGINETFLVRIPKTKSVRLQIYNVWGSLLYEASSNANNELTELNWDGKYKGEACNVSTYYYLIEAETISEQKKVYKGFVSLMK